MCDPKARAALVQQFVEIIRKKCREMRHEPVDFADICEALPLIRLKLKKADLGAYAELQNRDVIDYKLYMQGYHRFCHHHWRPEDIRRAQYSRFKGGNTGVFLWGDKGRGKSQILSYCTAWAHEKQWINFTISNPEEFVGGRTQTFRWEDGLYLQQDLALKMLKAFKHSNEQIFREFEVDMNLYGKFSLTGVKDGDPEPCPRVYDK